MNDENAAQSVSAFIVFAFTVCAVAVLLGAYGFYTAMLIYAPYDDEGYLMLSRQLFQEGRALYSDVYAQHGPFYFAYHLLVHGFGAVQETHTLTRLLTVAHWLLASVLCGVLTYRITRSLLAAGLAFFFSAGHLQAMFYSAGHPQELIAMLTPLAGIASCSVGDRRYGAACAALLGVIGAALVLTKINVGVFYTLAFVFALLCARNDTKNNRLAIAAIIVVMVALPFGLMRADAMPGAWAFPVAGTMVLGTMALGLATRQNAAEVSPMFRVGIYAAGGAILTVISVCALMLLRGTTVYDLIDGVVLNPLRFYESYAHPREHSYAGLALGLCTCGVTAMLQFRPELRTRRSVRWLLAIASISFAVATFYFAWTKRPEIMSAVALPCLWFIVISPAANRNRGFARVFLAALTLLYTLQLYPWSGSQAYMATFLCIVVAAVALSDGIVAVLAHTSKRQIVMRWRAIPSAALIAVLAVAAYEAPLRNAIEAYQHAEPLGLPGTAHMRPVYSTMESVLPSNDIVPTLNWIANNLRAHSDTYLSAPGLLSFYFWTGQAPPTGMNASQWTTLFREDEQRAIVAALEAEPRVCVLYNVGLLKFWQGGDDTIEGPLADYISMNFRTIQRMASYEFMIRNDRPLDEMFISLLAGKRLIEEPRNALRLPTGLIGAFETFTLAGSFRAASPGVILGLERADGGGLPAIYVGDDGRLRCQLFAGAPNPIVIEQPVLDGAWHSVAIVNTGILQAVYVDGELVASKPDAVKLEGYTIARLGRGRSDGWPGIISDTPGFVGELADFALYPRALQSHEIAQLSPEASNPN